MSAPGEDTPVSGQPAIPSESPGPQVTGRVPVLPQLLLGVVAGLVVGVGGSGLAWALTSDTSESSGGGGRADAAAACAAIHLAGDFHPDDLPNFHRWFAATNFAAAAAAADGSYRPLAYALAEVTNGFMDRREDPQGPQTRDKVNSVRDICNEFAAR